VVGAGCVHVLGLHLRGRRVPLVRRVGLRRVRAGVDSAPAAVVADMVVRRVVDHSLVVNIVNIRDVHIVHRAVVVKGSVIPISAFITGSAIAVAVIYATVEADPVAPIALVPGVGIVAPTPVTWSPEKTGFGGHHPCAWHPEVAFVAIGPVAGRPQITLGGSHWLRVHREFGRSDRDGHAELCERRDRDGQY
jgi:hypothetical protein